MVEKINEKVSIFSIVFLCFVIIVLSGFVYAGFSGSSKYKSLHQQLRDTNQQLTESIAVGQSIIDDLRRINEKLESENSKLRESIANRERIISTARADIEGTKSSLDKIESIIKILQNTQ